VSKPKFKTEQFLVAEGAAVKLRKRPTLTSRICPSDAECEKLLEKHRAEISQQQELLYAINRNAVLLVFQGMDTAGKDGAIKHVMSGIAPQGCVVHSFKPPSMEELGHDFLWRAVLRLPPRGIVGIFNRSHYEEVIVVRVHPEMLASQHIIRDKSLWRERYRSINDWERHLHSSGTMIIKFFLHLSKDEQKKRLQERLEAPTKIWKSSMSDVEERNLWKRYVSAYEKCLTATNTANAPWYVVPADDKENARLIISGIILERLYGLKLKIPDPSAERLRELEEIRVALR